MKRGSARRERSVREAERSTEDEDNRPRILQAISYGDRVYGPAQPERGKRRGDESELAKVIRTDDIPRLKKIGAIAGTWRGATGQERREMDESDWSSRPQWERDDMIRRGTAPSFATPA